ncbi:MAG: SusC/RagA family TonB-linked outer membrane protein [Prevotella sp.]|jgi:TonB-linked SusC/RagA family outer membrane protein
MMKQLLVLIFALCSLCVGAQNVTITGKVVDQDKQPLTGVSVVIKGTSNGVSTDLDGNFELEGEKGTVLSFSYIGMVSKDVTYNGKPLTVVLEDDAKMIEDVVVIGYQTVKKTDLTGAVSVVKSDDMNKSASNTLTGQLQGLATGVNVRSTGRADGDAIIQIRGVGSLSNNSPLWIVDGMITNPSNDFNPADIESIQILKDASAAAIYGSRAANGVIIVTTKKGKKGPMKVNFSVKETIEWSPKYDLMNAEDYKYYNDIAYNEAIKNNIGSVKQTQLHSEFDTDWQKEVLKTALVQDYNVSLSGGGDTGSYYVSGGYLNNDGVSYGNKFERFNARVNTEGHKGMFAFGENLSLSMFNADPNQTNTYNDLLRMLPTIPVYDENNPGGYGYGDAAKYNTFGVNPIARENLEYRRNKQSRVNGSIWLEFKPVSWLSYKLNAGIDFYFWEHTWFRKEGNWTQNQEHRDPEGSKARDNTYNTLIEHTLNFNKDFGKHHVDAVLGMTYQHDKWQGLSAARLNFPMLNGNYLTVLDAGQSNMTNANSIRESAMMSYLGRANYNYDNTYYFSATFRRDGTSRLSKDNRWGTFPSFAAAWRISKESFFNVSWIDDLKLRANWGRLGNSSIGNWDYIGTINQSLVTVFNNTIVPGASQISIVNENLKWETKETTNIGFDAFMFNNRLGFSAEYYYSKTKDVLATINIPMTTGNDGGAPKANAASLRNTGFEFTASWRDKIGDFNYSATLNLTTLSNKVITLPLATPRVINGEGMTEAGNALGRFYLLKTDGLFRTQEDIDNYVNSKGEPIQINGTRPQLGDVKYIDTDDNGIITEEDRQIVGSPWAKLQASLMLNAEWKNFDFSMMWNGQFGNKIYNISFWQGRLFSDNSNYIKFDKGEEPYQVNPNSNTPRIIYGDARNNKASDRFLENGSYFRMKTISLGYTLQDNLLNTFGLEKLRFYVTGSNLLTITGYKGIDPDFANGNIWNPGTNGFEYPNTRSVMFGLDVTF